MHSNTFSLCPSLRLLPDTAICVLEILSGRVFPTQVWHAAWFDRCARGAQVDLATPLPDAGIAARILRVPRGYQSVFGADKLPNPSVALCLCRRVGSWGLRLVPRQSEIRYRFPIVRTRAKPNRPLAGQWFHQRPSSGWFKIWMLLLYAYANFLRILRRYYA